MTTLDYPAGSLVNARGRDWLVLPGSPDGTLLVRPLGGHEHETTVLLPEIDDFAAATFEPPTVDDRGDAGRARLLRDALRLSFNASGGPFRSFARLTVTPRNYQLVPLMMSANQDVTRLLIADGVGIGKTVEAGLIAAELLATGETQRLAVLCSPQLAPQWQSELRHKFGIDAQLLLPSTVNRLMRSVPFGSNLYQHHPHLVISTDYIKQKTRRDEFALHCPELVIVDEAHTCVAAAGVGTSSQAHLRYALLRKLADKKDRHLVLLTATPHSGDDTAWQSLIGLLDDRLGDLPADLSGRDREDDRKLLAKYMIQRQRSDIREYLNEDTPFPERETTETAYKLTAGYRQLFDDVMDYVREQVSDPKLSAVRQRVRWWSAIALLRCLASSPAAAEQTMLNRSAVAAADDETEVDAYAEPRVLDTDLDDTLEAEDVTVGADTGEGDDTDTKARKRLRELAAQAAALKGPRSDAKLKRLIPLLKELLDQGYHPIVFCRYIPTADYLAEHLGSALSKVKDLKIDAVTGTLPPEEREARVETLSAHGGPRLLIATDCLSEGINLQDGFTAVVHYDLAWNPTRHEQREGRVDRFGQQAPTVRTVTYYGEDNGIDGLVLEVLIRRHENIKRSIGVAVPIPVDSTTVMKAIWESLLLRGKEAEQLTLDFGAATSKSLADQVEVAWTNAAEREKVSRSRFRQAGLKPDTVEQALAEIRRALGGPADVETFTRAALSLLGAPITDTDDGFTATIDTLPAAVRDQLPPAKDGRLQFHRSLPVPTGHSVLTRTDACVDALSRYVLDAALDSRLDPAARPARRAGVMRTRDVNKVTTLLMVRHRLEITIPGSATTVTQVAEGATFLAFTATGDTLTWLPQADVDTLLTLKPSGNVDDSLARMQLGRALGRLDALTERLTTTGRDAARDLVSEHQAVRSASKAAGRAPTVKFLPPADVLGVYVFLPEAGAR
ncbi:helicase domain-containing protein [Mycobacteroides abscessus subsp. abscessus]|uniref:helicase-related protein n=1 Tax=Mycobacteroides abscessus TaxID=36809 RepID=UPI000929F991|nr:helicase-related protein [Mycobacteroides abscessus]SIF83231.1 helicase domain-containing protein [Mycobacteroides abscessus subsp. abscessus]SIG02222.1 helicase domain-containing protein [Mycobacteroides abscessus subsp. abscessus]SIG29645.1 helicase domain-containing protein [Mycobacteroides abscessus subsp. abscessus]